MSTTPDRSDVADYLNMVFGYCDPGEENFAYSIALRGLGEKGTGGEGVFNEVQIMPPYRNGLDVDLIFGHVLRWSNFHRASFIVPAAVSPRALSDNKATEDRILQLTTVVVDMDKGDTAARLAHAVAHLGEPSMVVHSGGITDENTPKLHAYWRLTEPSPEIARIAHARKQLALKVGGDAAFGRCTQVIRLPGSVYSKSGADRVCRIVSRSHKEYDLGDLVEAIEAMPAAAGIQLDTTKLGSLVSPALFATGVGLNFSTFKDGRGDLAGEKPDIVPVLVTDIHEGGDAERNRWTSFNTAAGLHIYDARQGRISLAQAEEVTLAWMTTHMVPPWPLPKFKTEWAALVNKDIAGKGPMPEPMAVLSRVMDAPLPMANPNAAPVLDMGVRELSGKWVQQRALDEFEMEKVAAGERLERKFLVEGLILAGKSHLLAAEGGAGKTFMLLDLAVKVASQEPGRLQNWCGMPLCDDAGGSVAMFTTEDDRDELQIRLHDILGNSLKGKSRERFFLIPTMSIGGAFPLVERERPGGPPLLGLQWKKWLEQLRVIPDLKLVVIDTLNTTLHGEENSATVINEYVQAAAAYVCGEFGAALVVTHHLRKPGVNTKILTADDMKNSIRGSTALTGAFRVVLGLWHASDYKTRLTRLDEEAKPGHLYNLAVVKANNPQMHYGLRAMLRQPSGLLVDITDRERAMLSAEAGSAAAWMVKAVEYAAEAGHPFTPTSLARKAPNGRREQLPPVLRTMSREDLEALCGRLISEEGGSRLVKCKCKGSRDYSHLDVPGGPLAANIGGDGGPYVIKEGADFKLPDWEALFVPHATEDRIVARGQQWARTPWSDTPEPPKEPKPNPNL